MSTKTLYKDSGTDWLGKIPVTWSISKISELFIQKKERSTDGEELLSVYRDHGVIPKSSRDDNHNKESEDLSNYTLIKPNDLVINKMKAWQGSVAISHYRGIVSPAYFTYGITRAGKEKLYLPYLHHLLRSRKYIETYRRISKGVRPAQWDLDPYQFKILPVLVPPFETQKRIADFLDQKTLAIDDLILKKEKMIELLKEKRAAIITRAVTKGLDTNTKLKPSGVEWVGNIPERWITRRGKYVSKYKKELNSSYQCDHVLALTLRGVINKDDYEARSLVPADYASYQLFEQNDLVFKLIDLENFQTSRVGIVGCEGIMSPAYIRIVTKKGFVPKYAYWYYYSLYLQGIYNFLGMGVRSTLNQNDLLSLWVLLPPQEEQKKVSQYLDSETEKIDLARKVIESQIEKLREYRSSLMYSAVTGKITV